MRGIHALRCAGCSRQIEANRVHFLLDDLKVLCGHCVASPAVHSRLRPDCAMRHDICNHLTDHTLRAGSRTVIATLQAAKANQRSTNRQEATS